MSDEIVWEDPPPARRGPGSARANPGQWAKFGTCKSQVVTHIRGGNYTGIDAGEFEALGRDCDKVANTVTLYVRYVGKPNLKAAAS